MSAAVTFCAAAGRASDRHNASIPVTPATRLQVALVNLNRFIDVLSLSHSTALVLLSRLATGEFSSIDAKPKPWSLRWLIGKSYVRRATAVFGPDSRLREGQSPQRAGGMIERIR